MAHEAAVPQLRLPHHDSKYWWLRRRPSDQEVERLLQANLDQLGIGPDFGLKLQGITYPSLPGPGAGLYQTVVRVQLTMGRGEDAKPLDNHGILIFRENGMLADYHAPLPSDNNTSLLPDAFSQARALTLIGQANQLRLDQLGAPLSIVRGPQGRLTVEARVIRGEGVNAYMEVFTPDNPRGERREILISPLPPDKRIPIPNDILK
jgi:hypothetical protein